MANENIKKHLSKDKVMKRLIAQYGALDWDYEIILFEDIINSIISQQLSVKAADTISKRFVALFNNKFPSQRQIIDMPDQKIRDAGISFSKIKYMKGIAKAILDGSLDLEILPTLKDEEVIEELVKLKGVGRWTAEMLLMFSLKRPDVFSMGDLGLRNAIAKLYGIDRDDLKAIEKLTLKWKPYRTHASRYLWKSLDNTPKK